MEHKREIRPFGIPLDQLQEGEQGQIALIPRDHPLATRLQDMGWSTGSKVTCLHKAPSGDPVAYQTAGVTVALRLCDAAKIHLSVSDMENGDGGDESGERGYNSSYERCPRERDIDNRWKGGGNDETTQ